MNWEEMYKLSSLECDLLVVQFYEFAPYLTAEIIGNKKLAYVIHSVPTPEPMPKWDPFGGNDHIRECFEKLCEISDVLVCVSEAEKRKMIKIYPKYKDKIMVVYNGMDFDKGFINNNYLESRKIYGFIGRTDYRKGIIECIQEFREIDAELLIACPKNSVEYVKQILNFVRGSDMENKIKFVGWCVGERKKSFFEKIDALIIPSLYEPFGYVALEGMQYGVPLISSNNGGLDEILEGYKYKYNPYRPGELKQTLYSFINDSNENVAKQQQILINNLDNYTTHKMVQNYNQIWDNILR